MVFYIAHIFASALFLPNLKMSAASEHSPLNPPHPLQASHEPQQHGVLPHHHRRGYRGPDDRQAALGEGLHLQLAGLAGQQQVLHAKAANQVGRDPV